jgi:hypothetical protein
MLCSLCPSSPDDAEIILFIPALICLRLLVLSSLGDWMLHDLHNARTGCKLTLYATIYMLLTFCCASAACTCFQVTPCMLRSLSACLLDLERFSYGRGRSRSLLPCPAMSTLTSCLACTVRLQHAYVRPGTLQIVTSQHHNYLHCHACMSS